MPEYWYIWYEVFEDGVKIGEGRYHRSYRSKKSAQYRAKQMWGIDLYSPITGTTFTRKWTVSETCPWADKKE